MGSAASKISKAKPTPRVPPTPAMPSARAPKPDPIPEVSEGKSEGIVKDGQDPTFLKNLSALGQVHVPHNGFAIRTDNSMLKILERRKATEEAAETPTLNRVGARTLSNLLDERKSAKTAQEVEELCEMYGVSVEALNELGKHVNAPSVSKITLPAKSVEEDDGETHLAIWVDPPVVQEGISA
ncbi:hypothetical protein BCR35DRAFT_309299 [Leucosporidium creatinivorum]|uniref:Uncharacterized protein n=1 Tax=Leucosporidium creatinivorum TaxID=106004 RepID=A0A1Y2DJN1_9BASI|nr:hypothetical protein BCR35DRAFT_309299 [Leucosporidium creatinivorum]